MTILLLPERKHLVASPINTWLTRGDRLPDQPAGDESLLRSVFDFDGPLAVAALTRQLDVGDAGDALWLRADPAWLRADMMTARMFAHGELGLSADDIAALQPDLAALFAEHGLLFDAPTPTRWYLRCTDDLALPAFADPASALGDDLKLHLPSGAEGKRWRVLTNDIQILLHNHPVNQRRVAHGAVAVNGLWLWGAGRLPSAITSRASVLCSDDPVGGGLVLAAGVLATPLADVERAVAAACGDSGKAEIAIDLRRSHGDSLFEMLDRLINRLRIGQVATMDLSLLSGERIRCRALHRWRIWR